ncbi:P-loop NTPase fold protein [uncultured Roseobacter sp.]|uniref:KAP family P-loop NTPase fold protein n=1 Tax=uncultured Roseobacter sp. TaxID=114847 RepID=UPI0026062F51|nr:P-loop NTPase fold protein [uncultured Roseobacter sp.]
MIGDLPLDNEESDRLGFGAIADQLAKAFLQNDLTDGFVIGVEGPWGSGKSSLVSLALNRLSNEENGPDVIRFEPWLIGGRDELLRQLFIQLEPAVVKLAPSDANDDVRKLLRSYAQVSSGLATLTDAAGLLGLPWAERIARFARLSGSRASELANQSLSELRQKLRSQLEKLRRPIVVFIDDLDRLEPNEAAEVLRLVRAVADFPNVGYILAYDPTVLAHALEKSVSIPDGKSYLEKIVQASFRVPLTQHFDLQNWLSSEVEELVAGRVLTEDQKSRLSTVMESWVNGHLATPRDVVRVLNFLRLNWLPMIDQVDPADAVFLQIVRTKKPKLYDWIEQYVFSLSAIGDWGMITPNANVHMGKKLLEVIDAEGEEVKRLILALQEHLTGIDAYSLYQKDKEFKVFSGFTQDERQRLASNMRLASPMHFRLYFSFSSPSGAISDAEVRDFLSLCANDRTAAESEFSALIAERRPQGGRMAEVMLYRLQSHRDQISSEQVIGLFLVLGHHMDELAKVAIAQLGYPDLLRGDKRQVFGLLERVDPSKRVELIRTIFSTAPSLAWLTGIIRSSTFAHGIYGEEAQPEDKRLLTAEEMECATTVYLKRLSLADTETLLATPHFLSLMYAWLQLGDRKEVFAWLERNTETDEEFLNVLSKMTSLIDSSNEGIRHRLKTLTLEHFFGEWREVEERLKAISDDGSVASEKRVLARELLDGIDDT